MLEFASTFFKSVRFLSSRSRSGFIIDDLIFTLHYRYTAKALYFAGIVSIFVLLFDDWIQCLTHGELLPQNLMNVYCWMQNTFTLPSKLTGKVGEDIISPGIDRETPGNERIYVTYYQWLPLVLFLQGLLFEFGHYIWRGQEFWEMENISSGFQFPIAKKIGSNIPMTDDERERGLHLIAECIHKGWSMKTWSNRPWLYLMCIFFNSANVVLQVYFLMVFLKINELSYGWEVYRHIFTDYVDRNDTMVTVFPKMVKCIFYQFGAAGSAQTHDIICLLPFNVYSELFFAVAFVWFYFLAIATIITCLFWFSVLASSSLRKALSCSPHIHMLSINDAMIDWLNSDDITLEKWFMMWLLCKNIHANHIQALVEKLISDENKTPNEENGHQKVLNDFSETEPPTSTVRLRNQSK
ncbi:hypothetical protein CHUAL_012813 [Chamberlinius hualienensis]